MKKIFTKEWFLATLVRMIRTFAEGVLSVIGTGAVGIMDINWLGAVSVGLMAAVVSFLLALSGLPEVPVEEKIPPDAEIGE